MNTLTWPEKWLLLNEYRMTYWQLKRTQSVTGLLSIPMLVTRENKPDKSIGVINVDSITEEGAKHLAVPENLDGLISFFSDQGKVLALMDF